MKKQYLMCLLVVAILALAACSKSGTSSGSAPTTPFIGGTSGMVINFEKDSPPPEVTDDQSFAFNAIVRLQNDGEHTVEKNDVKLQLLGFDPADFGAAFEDVKDVEPEDDLTSKKRDAEGNIIEGTTTFATFPRNGGFFVPTKFPGNTEFTVRANVCYNYETQSNSKLCVLRDMINVRDDAICRPNGARTVYSSSAPVQVTSLRQTVVGQNKISFSFDIVLSGNVDIFWDDTETTPSSGFDVACPRAPRERRIRESRVGVEVTEKRETAGSVFTNLKCGGLFNSAIGDVQLVNGRRTITCTADMVEDRVDLEKQVEILLKYNVLDNKETRIVVKHLSTDDD